MTLESLNFVMNTLRDVFRGFWEEVASYCIKQVVGGGEKCKFKITEECHSSSPKLRSPAGTLQISHRTSVTYSV